MNYQKGDVVLVIGDESPSGKTRAIELLLPQLELAGFTPVAMKPVETACPPLDDHDIGSRDGATLHRLLRGRVPLPILVPYRFRAPGPSRDAARAVGLELTLGDLVHTMNEASRYGDILVVEVAGSLHSALAEDGQVLELAERVSGKLLPVGGMTPQGEATLAVAAARGLTVVREPGV